MIEREEDNQAALVKQNRKAKDEKPIHDGRQSTRRTNDPTSGSSGNLDRKAVSSCHRSIREPCLLRPGIRQVAQAPEGQAPEGQEQQERLEFRPPHRRPNREQTSMKKGGSSGLSGWCKSCRKLEEDFTGHRQE